MTKIIKVNAATGETITRDMTAEEQAEFDARQITPPTAFEQSMIDLRHQRNNLLMESDWTILPDSPIADKTAWQTYRTELRDLTNGLTTVEQVEAVTWPTKPGA
jgi:hypothetical protein